MPGMMVVKAILVDVESKSVHTFFEGLNSVSVGGDMALEWLGFGLMGI